MFNISKKEWIFVIIASFLMIIITTAPYFYGYLTAPEDKVFVGSGLFNNSDLPVYYSYIEQVKQGNFLFENLFTSEPTNIRNLNILWLDVGLFARIFNLSPFLAFQIYRIILTPLFLAILYIFISYFFVENRHDRSPRRKIGFIFALLASGLGGWAFLLNHSFFLNFPYFLVDLNVPEMNIFLILYQSPHFIASLGLMLLSILLMLMVWDKKKIRYSFLAGLILLLFFQFHPYYAPLLYALFGVFSLWKIISKQGKLFEEIKLFLPMFLISLPSVLYHAYLLNFDFPIFARAIQTETITPAWWVVIMSFGFLFIFSILGIFFVLKNKEKRLEIKYQFLIFWFLTGAVFLYFPVSFQRRFIEGLSIPMIILSLILIFKIIDIKKFKRVLFFYFYIFIFLLLFCFSNVVNYTQTMKIYKNKNFPFYFSENIISGMDWMKNNVEKESIVLSFGDYGDFIPGFSGRRVYLGHWSETAFAEEKEKLVKKFFENNKNDEARYQFLKNQKIDYIFYSEGEKELGEYNPEEKSYLEKVFENEEVKIYKVN